jgi:hypothetical protein
VARKEGIDAAGLAQQRLDLEPASVVDAADHMAEVEA